VVAIKARFIFAAVMVLLVVQALFLAGAFRLLGFSDGGGN
jgi:hypothetical protein